MADLFQNLSQSQFLITISYSIHISCVLIQLNNKLKIHSAVADWTLDHLMIPFLAFSFIYLKCKIYCLNKYTFLVKRKLQKKKKRHFVKCVQIWFFHVYSKEITKLQLAGSHLSESDGQRQAAWRKLGDRPSPAKLHPGAQVPLLAHQIPPFSWVTIGQSQTHSSCTHGKGLTNFGPNQLGLALGT